MSNECRRQEAEGRREQLIENPGNYSTSQPLAANRQNPLITVCSSNASYSNRGKQQSERQFVKPSASCPLPSAFPPKEDTPLKFLCTSPESINPAIITARHIQHLELSGQVTPEMMAELAKEAKGAIAQGKQAIADYDRSLEKLKLTNSQPNQLPWGF